VAEHPVPIVLRVQLLGGFRVWVGEVAIAPEAWRPKAAALVKLLALSPRHQLHREEVLEALWPNLSESAAINNLHRTLHPARRTLETPCHRFLRFEGEQLVLDLAGQVCVDSRAFTELAQRAFNSHDPPHYEAALALYQGELLPEDLYADWAARSREDLHGLYLELATDLAEMYLKVGNCRGALELLRQIVQREPALEAAHLSLMRVYLRLDQPHNAVAQYERLRRALRREYGFVPSEGATELYQRLLDQLAKDRLEE
jgi:DNA-binding SARP family transcriptional activator